MKNAEDSSQDDERFRSSSEFVCGFARMNHLFFAKSYTPSIWFTFAYQFGVDHLFSLRFHNKPLTIFAKKNPAFFAAQKLKICFRYLSDLVIT